MRKSGKIWEKTMAKKIVEVDSNEWYPVYEFAVLDTPSEYTAEVEEETIERWKRIFKEFRDLQTELENLGKED